MSQLDKLHQLHPSGQAAFGEFGQRPLVFLRELVHDALRFQFLGQHFPRVSFHFEVRADLRVDVNGVGVELRVDFLGSVSIN